MHKHKTNPAGTILAIIAVIILLAFAWFASYLMSAPHTAAEALLIHPLAGERANYEARGNLMFQVDASGVKLPQVKVPYKLRVAEDKYHLEMFMPDGDDEKAVYETYLVRGENGWEHHDSGSIIAILGGAAVVGSIAGIENDDIVEEWGLPDLSSVNITPEILAKLLKNTEFKRYEDHSTLRIDGEAIEQALSSMVSGDEDGELTGLLKDALASSAVLISYDEKCQPDTLFITGAEVETPIEAGFLGEVNIKINIELEADFSRVGDVEVDEVEAPNLVKNKIIQEFAELEV